MFLVKILTDFISIRRRVRETYEGQQKNSTEERIWGEVRDTLFLEEAEFRLINT
jgi:hypothetical protein